MLFDKDTWWKRNELIHCHRFRFIILGVWLNLVRDLGPWIIKIVEALCCQREAPTRQVWPANTQINTFLRIKEIKSFEQWKPNKEMDWLRITCFSDKPANMLLVQNTISEFIELKILCASICWTMVRSHSIIRWPIICCLLFSW
jgi:hypothetical protein